MILVIGATGVVGCELIPRVLEYGQTVRAMSRSPEKWRSLFNPAVELVGGDLEDSASLRAALTGIGIPGRLGEEPLQALGGRLLGTDHRFDVGQGGQRLVAFLG